MIAEGHEAPERNVMGRRLLMLMVGGVVATSFVHGHVQATGSQQAAGSPVTAASSRRAVLDTYCVTCHNQRLRTAGLTLDSVDVANVGVAAELWEKVLRKVGTGAMPPAGRPRPDQSARHAFVSSLETALDTYATRHPNPGRTDALHRLNRAEYQNAIRDLLALDVDISPLLPADDADKHGFDNIANVLSVSPTLFERYLSAARKLSRLAVGLPPSGPVIDTYDIPRRMLQDDYLSEDLPLGSRGGVSIRHHFPVDGEYDISVRLQRTSREYMIGLGEFHQLEIRVDGERVRVLTVGQGGKGWPAPVSFAGNLQGDAEWELYALTGDTSFQGRFPVQAGQRVVGVSFVDRRTMPEDPFQLRPPASARFATLGSDEVPEENPAVAAVSIGGPYHVTGTSETPSRLQIMVCRPANGADEEPCARKILSTLARRAYRRPVVEKELQALLGFYQSGRAASDFDGGIQFALERLLVDPNFLFRVERDPANSAPGSVYPLTDLELASRLSFFLWSSIPDDELLDLAIEGTLREPAVLERQVRRLLVDRRSKALIDNFVGQWLALRSIRNVSPDPRLFPDFDENLRDALEQETRLFVGSQLREDRSVLDLLRANYTFVNERLARHYQIPGVYGNGFRRLALNDDTRGGLLGHASLLTVTSYGNRTSPVLRGKWVLESLLGTPPLPPPPDVPGLPDGDGGDKPTSVRERLERHRENPVCASCHAPMDPLGFALENFDAVGAWRSTNEAGTPVDTSATLPDGTQIQGVTGLRTFLLSRPEQFAGTVTEKLLGYALGRGVQYHDFSTVRRIVREAASTDYRWSNLIVGIVTSTPFQMRTSQAKDPIVE